MNVLILSCNTGEGHNACGRAVKEYFEQQGETVTMLDYMTLAGPNVSRIVGGVYVSVAKHAPHLFGFVYHLGLIISNRYIKSPVYYANKKMAKYLKKYLDSHHTDVIVMPHLYPAETITYMKKKYKIRQTTIVVCTDYTCIPFWEETSCDYYILPHEDLVNEYVRRGLPKEKLFGYGIPVKRAFTQKYDVTVAKEKLHLLSDKPMYLVMSGSMGFGKIQLFTYRLNNQCKNGEQIVVICGNNNKLRRVLMKEFKHSENVHIVGFTNHVAQYMQASDVIYTKPGGLTSTEVAVANRPLVHTAPIPGCESKNVQFFSSRGMSLTSKHIGVQIKQGKSLVDKEDVRNRMLRAQQECIHPDAVERIYQLARGSIHCE